MKKIILPTSIMLCAMFASGAFATTYNEVSVDGVYEAMAGVGVPFHTYNSATGDPNELTYGSDGYFVSTYHQWNEFDENGKSSKLMVKGDSYEEGKTYGVWVCVLAKEGNDFANDATYKINGEDVAELEVESDIICGFHTFVAKARPKYQVDKWPEYTLSEDGKTGVFTFTEDDIFKDGTRLHMAIDDEELKVPLKLTVSVPVGSVVHMQYVVNNKMFRLDSDVYDVEIKLPGNEETGMGEEPIPEVVEEEITNPNTSDSLVKLWAIFAVSVIGIVFCGWYVIKSVVGWLYLRCIKTMIQ